MAIFTKLFKTKEKIEYSLGQFKLLSSTYNNKECSKLTHYNLINTGEVADIINNIKTNPKEYFLPIYRVTAHSIYTTKIKPYSKILGISDEYKQYVFYKINEGLKALHDIEICHADITIDSIFINTCGIPIIADIINCKMDKNTENDINKLNKLCEKETNVKIHKLKGFEVFLKIEQVLFEFNKIEFPVKTEILSEIEYKKDLLPGDMKLAIFKTLLTALDEDVNKEEKNYLLEFMRDFDEDLFKKNQLQLFRVIDYNVRMYMLNTIESIDNLDECVSDIALGIRVKEKLMKMETLSFIFKYDKKFSKQSFVYVLYNIAEYVTETEAIQFVCKKLLETDPLDLVTSPIVNKSASVEFLRKNKKEYKECSKAMYKVLLALLNTKKCKQDVYACYKKYFTSFNKGKMASELLPTLCSKLAEKEYQEELFQLVEQIVQFLKENRNDLEITDWSLKKVKDAFKTKSEKREEAFQNKVSEIKHKEGGIYDEWDDQEI